MCVTKLMSTSGKATVERWKPWPVRPKTHGRYRVLRAASPRGGPRSVHRDWVGRNAEVGVKGLSPDNHPVPWWPSSYGRDWETSRAKAAPALWAGTTGVLDHGMSRRPTLERERSARRRAEAQRPWPQDARQGWKAESASLLRVEVRCPHSSDETGESPWSEGGHGE
jgi:hypothetical protein